MRKPESNQQENQIGSEQLPFSLRNVFLGLIAFFFLLGVVFVFVSTTVFFGNLNQEVQEERQNAVSSMAQLIFANAASDFSPNVIRAALTEASAQRGVLGVHLVNTITGEVYISTDPQLEGAVVAIPEHRPNQVSLSEANFNGTRVVNFTYSNGRDQMLWLVYERLFLTGPTLVLAIQQTFLFASLIVLFATALYIILRNFIVGPLQSVQQALRQIGNGDLSKRLPEGPPNEFGQVFTTFNTMAEQLQTARERDQRISEMKSNFISTAAHQLRTPITGIRWALHAVVSGDFGDVAASQEKVLNDASEKTKELSTIVSTLLDTAGLEEGKAGYQTERYPVRKLLEDIVQEYSTRNAMQNHEFVADIFTNEPDESVIAEVDPERLRWVIRNLLDNAIYYTPAGGTISLTATKNGSGATIRVQDSGIGIPESEQEHIFTKFYRASNAVRVKSKGNGLGLSIAKNIIEHHGGTLNFTSAENKGTTFTIQLPCEPPNQESNN